MQHQEVINELFSLVTAYHLLFFTQFVYKDEDRKTFGWSFFCVIGFTAAFNLGIMTMMNIKQAKLDKKRKYALKKHKEAKEKAEKNRREVMKRAGMESEMMEYDRRKAEEKKKLEQQMKEAVDIIEKEELYQQEKAKNYISSDSDSQLSSQLSFDAAQLEGKGQYSTRYQKMSL